MSIPVYSLDPDDAGMYFSVRTMEEIDARAGGQADAPHRHDYFTILWSFTATGSHFIDFEEWPILPYHVFFIRPGQVHQVVTDPHPTGWIALFTRDFLSHSDIPEYLIDRLRLFRNQPLALQADQCEKLRFFAQQMLVENQRIGEWKHLILGAYLKLFLIECNRQCLVSEPNTQALQSGRSLWEKFEGLLEKEFRTQHQVAFYAAQLHLTPNYLNEVLRDLTGHTAKELIQNRLLLEARRLARFSDLSAKETAFELGFADPAHFSRWFKNCAGVNFGEFRSKP